MSVYDLRRLNLPPSAITEFEENRMGDVPEFVRLARSRVFPLHIPDRDDHSGGWRRGILYMV